MHEATLPNGRSLPPSLALGGPRTTPAAAPPEKPGPSIALLEDKVRALLANQDSLDLLEGAARSGSKAPVGGSAEASSRAVANPKSDFVATVQKNFKRWDSDKDGTLERAEIDKAVTQGSNKGRAAAALAELNALEDSESFRGFGAKQLKAAEATYRKGDHSHDDLMGYYERKIQAFRSERSLFGADGQPELGDIHQGTQGDCYFLSSLGSKVLEDPQGVKDMIHRTKDGGYRVSFADGEVTVKAPTDAQAARGAEATDGRWVPVMEKAYAAHTRKQTAAKDPDAYESIGKGGYVEGAMATLGSKDARTVPVSSFGDFRESLSGFLEQDKWVNAIVWDSPAGLPEGHAYTIEGFDRESDTITVRNPWGFVSGGSHDSQVVQDLGDGRFAMNTDDFLKNFADLSVG